VSEPALLGGGHDSCRLSLKQASELGATIYADELWFIKHGLHEHALAWARGRYGDDEVAIPELTVAMFFERPPRVVDGLPANLLVLNGHEAPQAVHVCGGRAFIFDLASMLGPEHTDADGLGLRSDLTSAVMASRLYAALPLTRRPSVDVDVATATGGAAGGSRPPAQTLIVRWRQTPPEPISRTGVARDIAWTHRWMVRAHLRTLHDGRLVPVRSHIKGPADRPLVLKRTTNYLMRHE
jgi:hypothetical protein